MKLSGINFYRSNWIVVCASRLDYVPNPKWAYALRTQPMSAIENNFKLVFFFNPFIDGNWVERLIPFHPATRFSFRE